MPTEVKIDIKEASQLIIDLGLAPGGKIQKFFSNELLRVSNPYTPFDNEILVGTAYVSHDGTEIIYPVPYARYLWHGKLMVDPITKKGAFFKPEYGFWSRPKTQKELTNRDLKFQGAPLRGPKWVERAYIDNKATLLSSLEMFANRR